MHFRWLGAAGVELESGGQRLLVDPYLTRVPFRYLFFGRPRPDRKLILSRLLPARAVLITHPHYDHLFDVPVVCTEFGTAAYGSPNAHAILTAFGIPAEINRIVHTGDRFQEGPFSVGVYPGQHEKIGGRIPYTGELAARLKTPLKLSEFRMDCMYSYRVSAGGTSFLFWNTPDPAGAPEADVLVITAARVPKEWSGVIAKVKPKAVILIHWDDFFSRLDRPIRPMLAPPRRGERFFRRMDPHEYARSMGSFFSEEKIFIPDIFRSVAMNTIC
jgi:L-ascorbate metabolism protein UlaG (beta-lactamase superfamily)